MQYICETINAITPVNDVAKARPYTPINLVKTKLNIIFNINPIILINDGIFVFLFIYNNRLYKSLTHTAKLLGIYNHKILLKTLILSELIFPLP